MIDILIREATFIYFQDNPIVMRPIRELDEQSGFFSVLTYLHENNKGYMRKIASDLEIGNRTLYKVIDILSNYSLIEMKEEKGKANKMRKVYYLTQKGKLLAEKVKEIENLMVGE